MESYRDCIVPYAVRNWCSVQGYHSDTLKRLINNLGSE